MCGRKSLAILALLATPREGYSIGTIAYRNHWIVGKLDTLDDPAGKIQKLFLRLGAVRHRIRDGNDTEFLHLARLGPRLRRIVRDIAWFRNLRLEVEDHRPTG